MIEQLVDAQPGRRGRARDLQHLADPIDDRKRRRVAVLDDAQQDGALAVFMDDVLLHRPSVVHLADILQKHCGSARVSDRNVVEVVDRHGHRVGAHGVLGVPDLGEA